MTCPSRQRTAVYESVRAWFGFRSQPEKLKQPAPATSMKYYSVLLGKRGREELKNRRRTVSGPGRNPV